MRVDKCEKLMDCVHYRVCTHRSDQKAVAYAYDFISSFDERTRPDKEKDTTAFYNMYMRGKRIN